MGASDQGVTRDEILAVFETEASPHEPLATSEVADAVDRPRRTVYDTLKQLVDDGPLETKKVGARARVWWRPPATDDPAAEDTATDDPATDTPTTAVVGTLELTSEHVRTLEFESEAVAQPFVTEDDDEFHAEAEGIVSLDDSGQLEYWAVRGISPTEFFEALDAFPTVQDARLLSTTGETFRIEVLATAGSLMTIFTEFEGKMIRATIDDERLTMVGEFPVTEDVSAIVAAARRVVDDIRLLSQRLAYTPRLFQHLIEDELTERQWTALQAAYYGGYFNRPRDSTGDELAARLGVTRQTFHHHLRHAEQRLCRNLLEGVEHNGEPGSN